MTLQQLKWAKYPQYYISRTKLQTLSAAFIVLEKPLHKKAYPFPLKNLSTFVDFLRFLVYNIDYLNLR